MVLYFNKNLKNWIKDDLHFVVGLLGLIFLLHLNKEPSQLTPRFEQALPFSIVFMVIILAIGIVSFFRWLFSPSIIIVDFDKKEIQAGKKVYNFSSCHDINILTRSYRDNRFYRLSFYKSATMSLYKTPTGYRAEIPYQELMDKLDEEAIPFSVIHTPWLFKQKQRKEDAERNKAGS